MQTEARPVLEKKFALNQERCFRQQDISVVPSTLIFDNCLARIFIVSQNVFGGLIVFCGESNLDLC